MRRRYSPEDVCAFDGCGRRPFGHGLCKGHYKQHVRGQSLRRLQQDITPEERFWAKVNKGGPTPDRNVYGDIGQCWVWTSGKDLRGYGCFNKAPGEATRAHRYSWAITVGPVPDGLSVLHRCDERACVRPDHLFLGDQGDNMRDMAAKGRQWVQLNPERHFRGEQHPNAALTETSVIEARRRHAAGESFGAIARNLGVNRSSVARAVLRKSWKHVP